MDEKSLYGTQIHTLSGGSWAGWVSACPRILYVWKERMVVSKNIEYIFEDMYMYVLYTYICIYVYRMWNLRLTCYPAATSPEYPVVIVVGFLLFRFPWSPCKLEVWLPSTYEWAAAVTDGGSGAAPLFNIGLLSFDMKISPHTWDISIYMWLIGYSRMDIHTYKYVHTGLHSY